MHAVVPRLDITGPPDIGDPAITGRRVLQTWRDGAGNLVAFGGREGAECWMHWPGLGTFSFELEGPVRAAPVREGLDARLTDTFVRGVLPVVLLARGHEAFHASAVADAHGVTLLCATSGTGKSTLAIALAAAGLRPWADDTVVYRVVAGTPIARRVPFRPRIDDVPVSQTFRIEEGAHPDALPVRRVYLLSRVPSLDPDRPRLLSVEPTTRFARLLAHAHPVDMHGPERQRSFIEAVMRVAATAEMSELQFAPSLQALPRLCQVIFDDLRDP